MTQYHVLRFFKWNKRYTLLISGTHNANKMAKNGVIMSDTLPSMIFLKNYTSRPIIIFYSITMYYFKHA